MVALNKKIAKLETDNKSLAENSRFPKGANLATYCWEIRWKMEKCKIEWRLQKVYVVIGNYLVSDLRQHCHIT